MFLKKILNWLVGVQSNIISIVYKAESLVTSTQTHISLNLNLFCSMDTKVLLKYCVL